MSTQEPVLLNRRRLLCSSAALAAWAATGCDRGEESGAPASTTASPSKVPLRLTLVGQPPDAETITRAWEAVTDQPLGITLIALDRSEPEGISEAVMAAAEQTDVLILPLGILAEAILRELVVPLSGPEFDEADEAIGSIVSAARNGAARYAGESYAIPLGATQPFLLSSEEVEPVVDSWQAYDRLVERWQGAAAEPTAPGWAGAMFLWRSASERNWLFGRDSLEPLVQSEPYVRALDQMVQTCSRYQDKSQTPQQVWDSVASSKLRGGIGFPELRSELEGIVMVYELPGTTDASRVLLDPFSPVIALASSCRQSAVAKRFMIWISGGEGSQSVRRQIRGMTDIRVEVASDSGSIATSPSEFDLRLLQRLSSPVTIPTLQLLDGGEYYGALDRQVIRALNQELSPAEALAEVADQWQSLTSRVGAEQQLRIWRRAQGMRA